MTEYLLAHGLDPSVKDEQGLCAIDHIPFACKPGEELEDEKVSAATLERARQEHEEREARLAPQRAKRRAAEAERGNR